MCCQPVQYALSGSGFTVTRFVFLLDSGSCTGCSKAVCIDERACRAMGHLFHDTCFTCSVCSESFPGFGVVVEEVLRSFDEVVIFCYK